MSEVERLLQQIADEREAYTARIDAIEAVRSNRDPKVFDALIKAASSSEVHVRRKVVEVLAEFKDEDRALEAIKTALKDNDEGVRRNAVRSLAVFPDESVHDLLRRAERDQSPIVRRTAQEALKSRPRPEREISEQPPAAPRESEPLAESAQAVTQVQQEVKTPEREVSATPPPKAEMPDRVVSVARGAPEAPEREISAPSPAPKPIREGEAPAEALALPCDLDILCCAWSAAGSRRIILAAAVGLAVVFLGTALLWKCLGGPQLAAAVETSETKGERMGLLLYWGWRVLICIGFAWAVTALMGLGITRAVGLRVAAHLPSAPRSKPERESSQGGLETTAPTSALKFALTRWLRAFCLPIPCVLVLGSLAALRALLVAEGGFHSPILNAVLYVMLLGISVVTVAILAFLVLASPLWLPCVAVEDSSATAAISTSLLYVVRKPWTCLVYLAATALRAAAILALLGLVFFLAGPTSSFDPLSLLTFRKLQEAWAKPPSMQSFSELVIGLAQAALLLIGLGYALASLFAGAVGTYLAARAGVSGAPPAEIQT